MDGQQLLIAALYSVLGRPPPPQPSIPPHHPPRTSQQPRPLLDDHMGSLGLNLTLPRFISDQQTFDLNAYQIFEWDNRCDNKKRTAKYSYFWSQYMVYFPPSILHSHKPGFELIKVVVRRPWSGHDHRWHLSARELGKCD